MNRGPWRSGLNQPVATGRINLACRHHGQPAEARLRMEAQYPGLQIPDVTPLMRTPCFYAHQSDECLEILFQGSADLLRFYEAEFKGYLNKLGIAFYSEFFHDVCAMAVDRSWRDMQHLCDIAIWSAFRKKLHHFAFAG
jgi:hypothetical protein